MNITITFRHMEASTSIKGYAREKVAKLQKFLRQPMTAKVTLSPDKLKYVAETRLSSGGEHIEAREETEDMYASIDKMVDKLERIIRGVKETKVTKARRGGATLRNGALGSGVAPEPADDEDDDEEEDIDEEDEEDEEDDAPAPVTKRPRVTKAPKPAKKVVKKAAKVVSKPAAKAGGTARKTAKR